MNKSKKKTKKSVTLFQGNRNMREVVEDEDSSISNDSNKADIDSNTGNVVSSTKTKSKR